MLSLDQYREYMRSALELAQQALPDDVPVGALILSPKGEVIGQGYNQRERENNVSAHAELIAIEQASQVLSNWRLTDCTLIVTLEPCLMCTGAVMQSRLSRVVYAAANLEESHSHLLQQAGIEIIGGILESEASAVLKEFFERKRSA